jgi:anti-sigma factor RsiW
MDAAAGDCAAVLKRISAYLDGELERAECAAIEAHCATCPRCAPVIDGLRRTVGLCREARGVPLPDAVRQRARASIRRLLDEQDRGGS